MRSRGGLALLIATLVTFLSACSSSGGSGGGGGAAKFVDYVRTKATATATDVGIIQTDLQQAGDTGDTLKLATDAQTMHDNLADWYQDLLLKSDESDAQIGFVIGVKELRDATSKVVDWTDSPTSGATARTAAALRLAVSDWNSSVTTLWEQAGATDAPPIIG